MKLLMNKKFAILVALVAIVLSSLYGLSKRPTSNTVLPTPPEPTDSVTPDASQIIEETDEIYELGKSYFDNDTYDKAIIELRKVEESSNRYDDAQELLLKAIDYYRVEKIQQASKVAKETDSSTGYQAAIEVLQEALDILADDIEILDLIQQYRNCAPISFYQMADEDSEYYYDGTRAFYYHIDDTWYDTGSNLHNNVVSYPFGEVSTRLKLDGKFKKAAGTLFYFMDEIAREDTATLQFYGDNVLLFETSLTSEDVEKPFSVDLTGVIFLTVTMKTSWQGNYYPWSYQYAGISDFNLYKDVIE